MVSADPPLRWRALSRPKHGSTADEYEDAWATDPAAGRFAIADGASESAFAGLWARLLAEGFVASRRRLDLLDWLDGARHRWSATVMGLALPWYGAMKRDEGAFATLLGLDVRLPTPDRPGLWQAVAVGDSCLLRVRKGRSVRSFPVRKASDFGNVPRLIGSRDTMPPETEFTSGALLPGDRLFLMTDALALWFLHAHERGGHPWEAIELVFAAEQPEEAFTAWVEHLRQGEGLRDDDVTLLSIGVGCAPRE
jgi:hypothetical protein